ncbi:MAG: response regulator [Acidobacteriota bacterium]|nr:MAG: response regulator [Acidobacteriota bacterium]
MNAAKDILLVDDDREIRDMTALLLSGDGHSVRTAGSGEEALYLVHEQLPGLVLLDINMPGMDGWEVLRLLKEDDATAGVPVVMFSIRFELREKLHAMQRGAVDYITKPFDTEGLLRRVEAVLQQPAGDAA